MIKWIETTGKTEEEAIQNALQQLGMDRDNVSVEIVARAKKGGIFGLGAAPAKVKVTYEVPDEIPEEVVPAHPAPAPAPEAPEPKVPEQEAPPVQKAKVQTPPPAPEEAPAGEGDLEERIHSFLSGLFTHMGVEAEVTLSSLSENTVLVTLMGQKLGPLIGHRGETLDAVQQLTNYAVNRGRAKRVRIRLDAENYRAKREEALRKLAEKVAGKVVKSRSNITLEPMNAYERHVIHETLQDFPNVITYSTGTEPNRRTVVAFSRGKHAY